MVCASCELTVWELSRAHVTDEERKGNVEMWQGLFPSHSCIELAHAKSCVLLFLPQCLTSEGEAVSSEAEVVVLVPLTQL